MRLWRECRIKCQGHFKKFKTEKYSHGMHDLKIYKDTNKRKESCPPTFQESLKKVPVNRLLFIAPNCSRHNQLWSEFKTLFLSKQLGGFVLYSLCCGPVTINVIYLLLYLHLNNYSFSFVTQYCINSVIYLTSPLLMDI